MKKLLLWLFWIISLWLINFSSAVFNVDLSKFTFLQNYNFIFSSSSSRTNIDISNLWTTYRKGVICWLFDFDNISNIQQNCASNFKLYIDKYNYSSDYFYSTWFYLDTTSLATFSQAGIFYWDEYSVYYNNSWLYCVYWKNNSVRFVLESECYWTNVSQSFNIPFYYISYNDLLTINWWWWNDCSSVESQLSSCQSDLVTATWNIATLTSSLNSCQSDLISCQNDSSCTQLKCENDYQLIPESSINSEYCEDRFNLIDPENCPSSWWTGDIMWSWIFVNSHQINGAENVYLWVPDFLNWDYTYIDSGSTLEINIENEGDTDYIQWIIDINSYSPTNEEFIQSFVGGLTLLIPYIVIVLFVVAIWKLIRKIFSR